MAVTAADIRSEFPELARVSDPVLEAKLADAEAMTAADYSPDSPALRELRVKYLTCELLVLTPFGEFARLDPTKEPDGARSLYERQRLQLDRGVVAPMAV
jgi:hypothetical protein